MATVYDLKKVLDILIGSYKNADNFLVMTKLPGKKEPTSIVEFSVDDEQLYLSSDSEDNDVFTVSRLRNYITREAEEECWEDDDNFMSTFYDCEIVIYDYDDEIVYDLSDIIIDKNQLLLICSNDEENNDEDDEEEIEETKEEDEDIDNDNEEDSYDDTEDEDYDEDTNEELKDLVIIDEEDLELE